MVAIGGEITKVCRGESLRSNYVYLDNCGGGYWKSKPVYVPKGKLLTYRYGMRLPVGSFVDSFMFGSRNTEHWETEAHALTEMANHYDIFRVPPISWYTKEQNTFNGQIKFCKLFLKDMEIGKLSISEAFSNYYRIAASIVSMHNQGKFVVWLMKQAAKVINDNQKIFLAILLGQIASIYPILQGHNDQESAADSLLLAISNCEHDCVPPEAERFLYAVASPLINSSRYRGRLSAVVLFSNVLKLDDLYKLQTNIALTKYDENAFTSLIKKAAPGLKRMSNFQKKEMVIDACLTNAPTLQCLNSVVEEFPEEFRQSRGLNGSFMVEFSTVCETEAEKGKGYDPTALAIWHRVPKPMRSSLADGFSKFALRIVKDLEESSWNDENVKFLEKLILDKTMQTTAHIFVILEAMSLSQIPHLEKLILKILNLPEFGSTWKSLQTEKQKKLCKNCFDWLVISQHASTTGDTVVNIMAALEKLCERYHIRDDNTIHQVLGHQAIHLLPTAEDVLMFLLNVLPDVCQRSHSWFAQKWFVTQIRYAFSTNHHEAPFKLKLVVDALKKVSPVGTGKRGHSHLQLSRYITISNVKYAFNRSL